MNDRDANGAPTPEAGAGGQGDAPAEASPDDLGLDMERAASDFGDTTRAVSDPIGAVDAISDGSVTDAAWDAGSEVAGDGFDAIADTTGDMADVASDGFDAVADATGDVVDAVSDVASDVADSFLE